MDLTPDLVDELVNLHRLTQTELVIAEARRAQATNDKIERELAANADKGRERLQLLDDAIRSLGGVPDVLGVLAGRLGATAKLSFEQVQPLDEALLGDLALEHQLHDRAVFAKVLAETSGRTEVVRLLQRLEIAHAATIEWLTVRLAEVGVGGPPALAPGPTQVAVGLVQRALFFPARAFAVGVNRGVSSFQSLRERLGGQADAAAERSRRLAESAREVVEAGVSSGLGKAEQEARKQGASKAAKAIHETREDLGVVDASELPITGFDSLAPGEAQRRIRSLDAAEDVRTVLAYETAHKNRKGVREAATARIEELASMVAAS